MARRKRKAAASPQPSDQVVSYDLSDVEKRILANMSGKAAQLSAGNRMGADAFIKGAKLHSAIHDELRYTKIDRVEGAVENADLTDAEWRWAVAFRKGLGVGPEFYERAGGVRRRQLEQHYGELATHDTPKGRRAAKVVKVFVEYTLSGRTRRADVVLDFKTHGSVTGRMTSGTLQQSNLPKQTQGQLDAYRYLFQQRPKEGS